MKDRQILIMSAICALFFVMAGSYQPKFLFYHALNFHAALFFFVIGCGRGLSERSISIVGELASLLKKRLGGFYLNNLIFAVLTIIVVSAGIGSGNPAPAFGSMSETLDSIGNFFTDPFLAGDQYPLFATAWLFIQLFIVQFLFLLLRFSDKLPYLGGLLLFSVIFALVQADGAPKKPAGADLVLIRTSFAFMFYLAGYIIASLPDDIRQRLISPVAIVCSFILINVIQAFFGETHYFIKQGVIPNSSYGAVFLSTFLIVVMVYQLSHYIAAVVRENSLILKLGEHFEQVLIWHPTVFFVINLILVAFGLMQAEELLKGGVSHAIHKTWLIYVVSAVAVPAVAAAAFVKLKKRVCGVS